MPQRFHDTMAETKSKREKAFMRRERALSVCEANLEDYLRDYLGDWTSTIDPLTGKPFVSLEIAPPNEIWGRIIGFFNSRSVGLFITLNGDFAVCVINDNKKFDHVELFNAIQCDESGTIRVESNGHHAALSTYLDYMCNMAVNEQS